MTFKELKEHLSLQPPISDMVLRTDNVSNEGADVRLAIGNLTAVERLADEILAKQRIKGRISYGKGLDTTDVPNIRNMAEELADALQYCAAAEMKQTEVIVEVIALIKSVADPQTHSEYTNPDLSKAIRLLQNMIGG